MWISPCQLSINSLITSFHGGSFWSTRMRSQRCLTDSPIVQVIEMPLVFLVVSPLTPNSRFKISNKIRPKNIGKRSIKFISRSLAMSENVQSCIYLFVSRFGYSIYWGHGNLYWPFGQMQSKQILDPGGQCLSPAWFHP